jgi:ribonuclease Z
VSTPSYAAVLRSLRLVWISHPHADHHLGLLRLLVARRGMDSLDSPMPPLLIIAPPGVVAWLKAYREVRTVVN